MKKKVLLLACIISIIFLGFITIIINGTGVRKYYSEVLQNTIDIPKFAFGIKESQGDDTVQVEFIMFGNQSHIVEQISNLYTTDNGDNDGLCAYDFMEWSVNDEKMYNHIVIVYEKV